MNRLAVVSALAALGIGGQAAAADFSYHYIDAGLILADAPGSNDGKGLALNGSMNLPQLYQNATVFDGLNYIDFDGDNLLNLEAGLGFHWPIARPVDFTGGVALEFNHYSGGGGSDLGFGLNAGVRARPFAPQWELDGGLKYVNIGHYDDTSVVIGARYSFQPGLSAGVALSSGDTDYWLLSVRWEL
ncbi:MAG TPA: hypothetical protein VMI92_11060 [Steroidobacteraceae bacterium]|nr:hypothetical protein [Steroidobacteraceae bacterium]